MNLCKYFWLSQTILMFGNSAPHCSSFVIKTWLMKWYPTSYCCWCSQLSSTILCCPQLASTALSCPPFPQLSSNVLNFPQQPSAVLNFPQLSSNVINCPQISSTIINCPPRSSTFFWELLAITLMKIVLQHRVIQILWEIIGWPKLRDKGPACVLEMSVPDCFISQF
jgi:hypothetical protein